MYGMIGPYVQTSEPYKLNGRFRISKLKKHGVNKSVMCRDNVFLRHRLGYPVPLLWLQTGVILCNVQWEVMFCM